MFSLRKINTFSLVPSASLLCSALLIPFLLFFVFRGQAAQQYNIYFSIPYLTCFPGMFTIPTNSKEVLYLDDVYQQRDETLDETWASPQTGLLWSLHVSDFLLEISCNYSVSWICKLLCHVHKSDCMFNKCQMMWWKEAQCVYEANYVCQIRYLFVQTSSIKHFIIRLFKKYQFDSNYRTIVQNFNKFKLRLLVYFWVISQIILKVNLLLTKPVFFFFWLMYTFGPLFRQRWFWMSPSWHL